MRIRKNHRQKRYRYNVNRKALKKKNTTGNVKDLSLASLWKANQLPKKFFATAGLSLDPNKTQPIPNYRSERAQLTKYVTNGDEPMPDTKSDGKSSLKSSQPNPIVEHLEYLSQQRAESKFRLPKEVVKHLCYFLDKYQFNYRAMTTDRLNKDQWTWKQFRMQIRRFKNIPAQFNKYLEKLNLPPDTALEWPEYDSDSEWS